MSTPINDAKVREIEKRLLPKYKISLVVRREYNNPVCEIFKEIDPQPVDEIDIEVARLVSNKEKGIRLGCLDMSKPDETEYSEKVYGWKGKANYVEEIWKFLEKVKKIEEKYRTLRNKVFKEMAEKVSTEYSKLSFIEGLLG